jgi:hypothetical protein
VAERTTDAKVRDIIETDIKVSVQPFIDAATALVDYVVTKDSDGILNTALLLQIETYLAAYYYAIKDGQYQSEKNESASATYQTGVSGKGLELNDWGRAAIALDVTGTLAGVSRGKLRASATWLGLPPSDQTDYIDRD